jgi:hypothetical protein
MEELAAHRDQVLCACAAQEPKLLPKTGTPRTSGADTLRASVQSFVQRGNY